MVETIRLCPRCRAATLGPHDRLHCRDCRAPRPVLRPGPDDAPFPQVARALGGGATAFELGRSVKFAVYLGRRPSYSLRVPEGEAPFEASTLYLAPDGRWFARWHGRPFCEVTREQAEEVLLEAGGDFFAELLSLVSAAAPAPADLAAGNVDETGSEAREAGALRQAGHAVPGPPDERPASDASGRLAPVGSPEAPRPSGRGHRPSRIGAVDRPGRDAPTSHGGGTLPGPGGLGAQGPAGRATGLGEPGRLQEPGPAERSEPESSGSHASTMGPAPKAAGAEGYLGVVVDGDSRRARRPGVSGVVDFGGSKKLLGIFRLLLGVRDGYLPRELLHAAWGASACMTTPSHRRSTTRSPT